MKYGKKTLQDFAALFKDPFLRDAVRFLVDCPGWPMPDFPMITLAGYINTSVVKSGVPLGGSQQVAFKISDLFRDLGGELKFNKRVSDLIVKDNNVSGVRLENGSEHLADFVLWAADGRTLIYDILKEKYISPAVGEMYNNWTPVKSIVHVMFGVNRDFSAEPHRTVFALEKPEIIAGEERKWLCMLHHSFDKSMSPEGKSVVEVWYDTDYDYWEKLYTDKDKYKAEKRKIAEFTISQLERRYPGFASQIEVTDVPTPMTYKRYTDNWRGSPDGWYMTNSNIRKMEPVHNLPGLNALYMAGQWTAPYTGTVIAALSGRQAVEILCKREGKKFLSSTN
jgi:phytoene dehydrogenase-like protein